MSHDEFTSEATGLNPTAYRLSEALIRDAVRLRMDVHDDGLNVPIVDCGVRALGTLEGGCRVAEICAAGRARVDLVPIPRIGPCGWGVRFVTDDPVMACLASQYAGWRLADEHYFAMGSGPMRAAAASEKLFERIDFRETTRVAVGVLEAAAFPPPEVAEQIARACEVESRRLTLLVARTSSLVGTVQVVARSVETALHKLLELGFDVTQVVSAAGVAPLPPMGGNDLTAMGRTNDAVLYGSDVTLWVHGDDEQIVDLVPQIPSSASRDYGRTFRELFESYDRDFYGMDPLLFSPARITWVSLATGRTWTAGEINAALIERSCAG
ncbi:MAG TPA: methenyltetrahydromethanopterin cyclohydrolase [Pirellulaceae bacterium]